MSFDSQFETMLIQVDNQETTKKIVFGNCFTNIWKMYFLLLSSCVLFSWTLHDVHVILIFMSQRLAVSLKILNNFHFYIICVLCTLGHLIACAIQSIPYDSLMLAPQCTTYRVSSLSSSSSCTAHFVLHWYMYPCWIEWPDSKYCQPQVQVFA